MKGNEKPNSEVFAIPDRGRTVEAKERQHAISVYEVGDVVKRKAANRIDGDQVYVALLESQITELSRGRIESRERGALRNSEGKSLRERSESAGRVLELSKAEARDLLEIRNFLIRKRDVLLVVDPETIDSTVVPKDGIHLLTPKEEYEGIRPLLEKLNYTMIKIKENQGVIARKGDFQFVFLYSSEKSELAAA